MFATEVIEDARSDVSRTPVTIVASVHLPLVVEFRLPTGADVDRTG